MGFAASAKTDGIDIDRRPNFIYYGFEIFEDFVATAWFWYGFILSSLRLLLG